jgi:hypothetical protein
LDSLLFLRLEPGTFIWDEDIMDGFPKDHYPYLYGVLSAVAGVEEDVD